MSIPLQTGGDKTDRFELLVVANPVWEVSWLVRGLPIDRFDAGTSTRRIEDGGGSALNTACALASAGWRVVAVGRVGDDREGRESVAALERRGIAARIEVIAGRTTKRNMVFVDERSGATAFQAIVPKRGVERWEEDPAELGEATWLFLDRLPSRAVGWLRQRRRDGLHNALTRHVHWGPGQVADRFVEALPFLEFLQLPEGDCPSPASATGREIPNDRSRIHNPTAPPPLGDEEVAAILGAGVGVFIRTRGARGVVVQSPGAEAIRLPARPTRLIDPTGAGDAFSAGFLDGLLSGKPTREAAERGLDWAARACRHLGARGWLDHEAPRRCAEL